ncbi:MAG: bleomycin resistance protein [Flavobacteriaceae bacterium]
MGILIWSSFPDRFYPDLKIVVPNYVTLELADDQGRIIILKHFKNKLFMPKENDLLSHAATVLPVINMTESLEFYTKQLGFTIHFTWMEPIDYAVLKRGGVSLHLVQGSQGSIANPVCVYSFVWDIDALFREFEGRQINTMSALGQEDYGMKEFEVSDPDGHRLIFGQGIE